jgi:hypothetical protein
MAARKLGFQFAMRNIGQGISTLAPKVARSGLSFPGAFTRYMTSAIRRIANPLSMAAGMICLFLFYFTVMPVAYFVDLAQNYPSDNDIAVYLKQMYCNLISHDMTCGTHNQSERPPLFWLLIGVGAIGVLLPWLLRFYVFVFIGCLKWFMSWVSFVVLGRDPEYSEAFSGMRGDAFRRAKSTKENQEARAASAQGSSTAASAPSQMSATDNISQSGGLQMQSASEGIAPTSGNLEVRTASAAATSPSLASSESNAPEERATKIYVEMKSRIQGLLSDLRTREEINLGIGMIFSIIGVIVLAGLVFYGGPVSNDKLAFAIWFIPRLSVGLFIQVFAYFFLTLDKGNLADIKYFNNEITNLESKELALELAVQSCSGNVAASRQAISKIYTELLKTERNFVIRKGERTAHMSRDSEEISDLRGVVKDLVGILKSK